MKIIIYRNKRDIDVQFEDGFIAKHRKYSDFKNGAIWLTLTAFNAHIANSIKIKLLHNFSLKKILAILARIVQTSLKIIVFL